MSPMRPNISSCLRRAASRLAIVLIVFGVFRAEALGQTFTYDSNGNLTTRTEGGVTTEYLYDIRNLLAEVRQGSQVWHGLRTILKGASFRKSATTGSASMPTTVPASSPSTTTTARSLRASGTQGTSSRRSRG